MRRRWIFIAASLVLVGAVAGWWYASPWLTLREMKEAAEARDAARLSRHIDYPALREDVKTDVRQMIAEQSRQAGGQGQALGSALAMTLAGPLIDAMLTPQGVQAMFAAPRPKDAGSRRPQPPVQAAELPIVERDGVNRFRVRDKDPRKGAMLFERRGFGWKLVGLDLPPPR